MDIENRLKTILHTAESSLQQLISEATMSGDYEGVMQLSAVAKELAHLAQECSCQHAKGQALSHSSPARSVERESGRRRKARKKSRGTRDRKSGYPRFFRRSGCLVKVGYSKRSGEYVHKVPRRLAMLVAEAVAKAAQGTTMMTAPDFMPIVDPESGSEIPQYQAYLTLAWLVAEKVVQKHGRQGYTVQERDAPQARFEDLWNSLPSA